MFGLDPRLIGLFGIVFIVLGIFSVYQGRKRLLAAQAQGQLIVWYKQVNILTGIEYLLLAVVLMLSLGINYHWFSPGLSSVLIPIYWTFLLVSAAILCMVMYQGMTAMKRQRAAPTATKGPSQPLAVYETKELAPHQRAEQARKRRERRHKAAEARRRRTGRA